MTYTIETITNEALKRYFTTLSQYGYINYTETDKLVILSFLEEINNYEFSTLLEVEDLEVLSKLVHLISDKTCLIPEIQKLDYSVGGFVPHSSESGSGGVVNHNELHNRELSNQHPISAITDLQLFLDEKVRYIRLPFLPTLSEEAKLTTIWIDTSGTVDVPKYYNDSIWKPFGADSYSKTESDAKYRLITDSYTKSEIDTKFDDIDTILDNINGEEL